MRWVAGRDCVVLSVLAFGGYALSGAAAPSEMRAAEGLAVNDSPSLLPIAFIGIPIAFSGIGRTRRGAVRD